MLTKLKLKSLKKKITKNLKTRDRSQLHATCKTIAFIINEDQFSSIETLYNIASSLGIKKDNCQFLAFQKYRKNVELKAYQLHHKHIKWNGVISNEKASSFLEQPFDLLIGFYNENQPYLDFLVSESTSRFKVGLAETNVDLFDLQIQLKVSQHEALINELNKYLRVLGKVV